MPPLPFNHLAIVGTGLLGGSIGLALRQRGFTGPIVGVGRRPETLARAVELGCIDRGSTDLAQGLADADLIILASPVSAILDALPLLNDAADPHALITDVGSTKRSIVAAAERSLSSPQRFVGAHPMAGGEAHGPQHARPDLFQAKPVVLTPTPSTDPHALDRVEDFWRALGMKPHRMDAADHDRTVARISHLPHALAVLLVALADRHGGLEVASTGFGDTTRIAAGDAHLWADIFLDNADVFIDVFDRWADLAAEFRQIVAEGRRDDLLALLRSAQLVRSQWNSDPITADRPLTEPT